MKRPLDLWRGEWGNAYHDRNKYVVDDIRPVFDRILDGLTFDSVLEVGCGLGHNLAAIAATHKAGIEPNAQARGEARIEYPDIPFVDGEAVNLPFFDDEFDLVLTAGLLIHIPPADIERVVAEIARVSCRYVVLMEYSAVEEEEREYRGERDVLWRRPFGKLFQAWQGMTLLAHDDADSLLYPGVAWWVLEKSGQ